jgi:hypothetical protein
MLIFFLTDMPVPGIREFSGGEGRRELPQLSLLFRQELQMSLKGMHNSFSRGVGNIYLTTSFSHKYFERWLYLPYSETLQGGKK